MWYLCFADRVTRGRSVAERVRQCEGVVERGRQPKAPQGEENRGGGGDQKASPFRSWRKPRRRKWQSNSAFQWLWAPKDVCI